MSNIIKAGFEALHLDSKSENEPTADAVKSLREEYVKYNQGHVFAFYDSLNASDKLALFNQLSGFKPSRISVSTSNSLLLIAANSMLQQLAKEALSPKQTEEDPVVEPLPETATASILDSDPSSIGRWYQSGLDLIAAGEVAVVLMGRLPLSKIDGNTT